MSRSVDKRRERKGRERESGREGKREKEREREGERGKSRRKRGERGW